jgi:hypothetical protein
MIDLAFIDTDVLLWLFRGHSQLLDLYQRVPTCRYKPAKIRR